MALIRRYSVQVDGISGWYDVTDGMPRTEALAVLKSFRAKSKRERRGQTFRLHELPSVRRKVANPSCKCSGGKQRNPDDIDAKTKFTLRREPLNSGGYDRYGEYFGRGAPLFVYEGEVPTSSRDVYGDTHRSQRDVRGHVRAADRQDAMAKIRQKYPMARFFGEKRKVANPARKRKSAAKRAPARRKAR